MVATLAITYVLNLGKSFVGFLYVDREILRQENFDKIDDSAQGVIVL